MQFSKYSTAANSDLFWTSDKQLWATFLPFAFLSFHLSFFFLYFFLCVFLFSLSFFLSFFLLSFVPSAYPSFFLYYLCLISLFLSFLLPFFLSLCPSLCSSNPRTLLTSYFLSIVSTCPISCDTDFSYRFKIRSFLLLTSRLNVNMTFLCLDERHTSTASKVVAVWLHTFLNLGKDWKCMVGCMSRQL
jgi:hypothetical protein